MSAGGRTIDGMAELLRLHAAATSARVRVLKLMRTKPKVVSIGPDSPWRDLRIAQDAIVDFVRTATLKDMNHE